MKVVTLNVRHGGGAQIEALGARLVGYDADVLIVTEYRTNAAGGRLADRLRAAGYALSCAEGAPTKNRVLVASRAPIDREWAFHTDLDPCRLWCVRTAGIALCGTLFPQKSEKRPYWSALLDGGVDLFIGDFNTGDNSLDKDPKGARFFCAEMPGRLVDAGYVDLWRTHHPGVREYSWFSNTGNGFRIDHAFALPDLAARVGVCDFDHQPRLLGETDHSGLVLGVNPAT